MYWIGPTLAPYVPVAGPEWMKCDVNGAESCAADVSERCVTSSGDVRDDARDPSSSNSSSDAHCLCVGGFSRRTPYERCRRQSVNNSSLNFPL